MNKEIPVYLFTGFLEAGKTKFLQGTLEDPRFTEGERTLVLLCEEGEEELDPSKFIGETFIESIEEEGELNPIKLNNLVKKYKADRVLVEFNGMWDLDNLFRGMPEEWIIYQEFMFANANTFLAYNQNMRQQMYNKLKTCDCIVLNRYEEGCTDEEEVHKIIRGANRRCDIVYERPDGEAIPDEIEDPLPYDFDSDYFEIADRDFAIWYRDMGENLKAYEGKTVKFKAICANSSKLPVGTFVVGREVMTCCVEDIKPAGIACEMNGPKPAPKSWVYVTAKISVKKSPAYGNSIGPVMLVSKLESAEEPEDPVASFY